MGYYLFICHIFGELSLNFRTSFACKGGVATMVDVVAGMEGLVDGVGC